MEGGFFLQVLLGLGLLCLFLHYFILGVSHACLFGQSPFLLSITAFLPNTLDLALEEVQDCFGRGDLPLKNEVKGKEGKEVAYINDDDADSHDIDEMLGRRNSCRNLDSHFVHKIVVQSHEDIGIDAGVSKYLSEIVVDEIILTGEVVEQTQFEGVVYREIRGR